MKIEYAPRPHQGVTTLQYVGDDLATGKPVFSRTVMIGVGLAAALWIWHESTKRRRR